MKNILPISTLEKKLPIYKVENDCIISKCGDYTVAFKVELPELFTKTEEEYAAMHSGWGKAIKSLPEYTVLHKQDWFIEDTYSGTLTEDASFLSKSFERKFNGRPFTKHFCYLYITKSSKFNIRKQSTVSTLVRRHIIPDERLSKSDVLMFMESINQFVAIVGEGDFIRLTRLTAKDIVGTKDKTGVLDRYFMLSDSPERMLADIEFAPDYIGIGDKRVCCHTLSDVDDLPNVVASDYRYEKLSTNSSSCNLSFASPVGLLLPCNHIYNQYLFLDDPQRIKNELESNSKRMHSLSGMSRSNAINKEHIDAFLTHIHEANLSPIRAHANIFAWSEDVYKLRNVKNDVAAALSLLGATPRHNTTDAPVLFWAGIPGNAADVPVEDTFITTVQQAICLFTEETNYQSSLSPFGIKLVDRFTGRPIHLDISDEPMKKGITTNRNKFILGPSGSGKSFFTNHMVRQYYEQGTHIVLVDTGNSYLGLCKFIQQKTGGQDGVYYTYTEENPIAFNPFYSEDGKFDVEKKESIKTLITTLWKKDSEAFSRSEEISLSTAVNEYIKLIQQDKTITPCFNTFYEFLGNQFPIILRNKFGKEVREEDFDLENLLYVLLPYYKGGEYDYLLNATNNIDLTSKRFVVFELDNIKDHKILFPVVTIIIMDTFISKMRKLDGIRKMILIEEAWKAIAKEGMAEFIKYLFKTVRKHFGEAVVVTQEIDDIIGNSIVKDTIINNSDCKILLDQRKYMTRFEDVEKMLGLTPKQKAQVLSINRDNDLSRGFYREVYIDLNGVHTAVYATEVSREEYFIYTTEQKEKKAFFEEVEKMGGDIEYGVRSLIENEIYKKTNEYEKESY